MITDRSIGKQLLLAAAALMNYDARAEGPALEPVLTPAQIEADWARQAVVRTNITSYTVESDALGGCDGVKNGGWGFHTGYEQDPWWQVDLAQPVSVSRLRIYNRCDENFAARASHLKVLLSNDAVNFQQVYQHDGTTFLGQPDGKPLVVELKGVPARFIRLQQPGRDYFHLDEVEVFAVGSDEDVALGKTATQSSTSQWSRRHAEPGGGEPNPAESVERGLRLAESLAQQGVDVHAEQEALSRLTQRIQGADGNAVMLGELRLQALWVVRRLALSNPLLTFHEILFAKRAPTLFPHVSDQYYGWFSQGGGGLYVLFDFKTDSPRVRCLTEDWETGSFLRPCLSYDSQKVLFAYARYYPHVADITDKTRKQDLPEDAFYHVFEMNIDGTGVRRLTHGYYDDFDARYLPNGDIVFLSTRKGTALQAGRRSAEATQGTALSDSYVRCGGDNHRPVAVYTLHAMNADGREMRAISAFENFEWTPSIGPDGRVFYARWDYIDRYNADFMSLWSTNPDGTNAQLVYGNYTAKPQCIFEARAIPGSPKMVFTATAHHSITGGSLVLLDRRRGTEYDKPLTRLTPEVCFPETEGEPASYYANPWPLSEEHYLVSWADLALPPHKFMKPDDPRNPANAAGIYLYDAYGNLNLLYRDPRISSVDPIPLQATSPPHQLPDQVDWMAREEGRFFLQDVYQGLSGVPRGAVKRLRIVGVPPKVQPKMNTPVLGVSKEDPGKFVLGTVPVEEDGSAFFRVPSGLPVFFQALDADGLTLQTMRSLAYVQPGQTSACIGCHESRDTAPPNTGPTMATRRQPSKITPGPPGSWPLRFDELVQPVLDKACVTCHSGSGPSTAARITLTGDSSYENLVNFGGKDLYDLVYEKPRSDVGDAPARKSKLYAMLTQGAGHEGVQLDAKSIERLATWMDTYAQKLGSFSESQEQELRDLKHDMRGLLEE
ncbi:MAG: discoidin domain-containing protein [Candidatus Hydrogenedentes bacterium]|nr:discoidin domain-containing protein [Candidatus Hydrogenedentota bacterium]